MYPIRIPVHSFVDVITNSSSEIYVSASTATITAVKELINSLLKLGQLPCTVDDLFDVKLSYTVRCKETDYDTKEFDTEEDLRRWMEENGVDYYGEYVTRIEDLVITPKGKATPELTAIAKQINELVYSTHVFEGQQ